MRLLVLFTRKHNYSFVGPRLRNLCVLPFKNKAGFSSSLHSSNLRVGRKVIRNSYLSNTISRIQAEARDFLVSKASRQILVPPQRLVVMGTED